MLPKKLRFIWRNGFREEEFKKSAHQKQESSVVAITIVQKTMGPAYILLCPHLLKIYTCSALPFQHAVGIFHTT
jgi:hypothetical protein